MKKRLERKIEKRRRAELHRVLDLCLDINGMQESSRKKTGDHPTAFLNILGHTGMCVTEIYPSGWAPGARGARFESIFAPNSTIAGDIPPGLMVTKMENYRQEVVKNDKPRE